MLGLSLQPLPPVSTGTPSQRIFERLSCSSIRFCRKESSSGYPSGVYDPEGIALLPNFLIIGSAKAGSTALAAYLSSHPQVFVAAEKEVHFFDDHFHRGVDWYSSRFDAVRGEVAVGDATPTYMYMDEAIGRMAALLPDAKLIAILRNPVDRAHSHYWWMRALDERRSFADAVHDEIQGREEPNPEKYIAAGRYLERLESVCRYYPRSSLHVVVLEDLRASANATFADVCRFLGVDDRVEPSNLGAVHNPAYRLRWPALRTWMMRMHAWRRLPFDLAGRIDGWNRVPFRPPRMDHQLRAELDAYYEPYNTALAAWLGRDLSVWDRHAAERVRDSSPGRFGTDVPGP